MESNNKFIFELNTEPILYDYNYLSTIEDKLYNSYLTEKEVLYLLKWIVYRSKLFLNTKDDTYKYLCIDAAVLVSALLESLKIKHHTFNMMNVIHSTYNIHELTLAIFQIDNIEKKYIIDPTFRQFLVKDKCIPNIIEKSYYTEITYNRKLPPYPGYFLNKTSEGKQLGIKLLNDGFFELTEPNMKLYSDAFMKYNGIYISDLFLQSGDEYIRDIEPDIINYDFKINTDIYLTPKELKKRMCNND